jgi:pimeloyl-ACP methyl ester carboxylesterase
MPGTATDLLNMIRVSEDGLQEYLRTEVPEASMTAFFGAHAADIEQIMAGTKQATKQGDSIIILLPGLTGSLLEDVGSGAEVLWVNPLAFLRGHLNHLDLDDDGARDATPGVRVEATKPIWIVYAKLMLALQQAYEVYSFAYDWRRTPAESALKLKDFIDQKVAASTRKQVTLVGHSMGGLVVMDYLIGQATADHARKMVKRAITLGAPFRGALDALFNLAKGDDPKMQVARKLNRTNDPLRMLRTFPGMYTLLPAPNGLYPEWKPLPDLNIWDPQTWKDANLAINFNHLAAARAHHQTVASADPQVPLYTVAGVYYPTPVQLMGKMFSAIPKYVRDGLMGGDGTVEGLSATFKDRPAYFVQEVHIELVLEKTVIEAIQTWVEGGQPTSLVRDVTQVKQDDVPLRGAMPVAPMAIRTDRLAEKIGGDQALTHDDVQTLFMTNSTSL